MGQYHSVYNITKKEMIIPHQLGDGAKLLEWGSGGATAIALAVLLCNSNGRGGGDLNAPYEKKGDTYEPNPEIWDLIKQVSGRWSGDRIVVQGDYAEKDDPAYLSERVLKGFKDISKIVVRALATDSYLRDQHFKSGYLVDKYVKPQLGVSHD